MTEGDANPYSIHITTLEVERASWEAIFANDKAEILKGNPESCVTKCGELKDDKPLFEKQFTILRSIGQGTNTGALIRDIKDSLVIFSGGIDQKLFIKFIPNGVFKTVIIAGADGFDVSMSNFYYKVIAVRGDKVVEMTFALLSPNLETTYEQLSVNQGENNVEKDVYSTFIANLDDFLSGRVQNLGLLNDKDEKSFRDRIDKLNTIISSFKFYP